MESVRELGDLYVKGNKFGAAIERFEAAVAVLDKMIAAGQMVEAAAQRKSLWKSASRRAAMHLRKASPQYHDASRRQTQPPPTHSAGVSGRL